MIIPITIFSLLSLTVLRYQVRRVEDPCGGQNSAAAAARLIGCDSALIQNHSPGDVSDCCHDKADAMVTSGAARLDLYFKIGIFVHIKQVT